MAIDFNAPLPSDAPDDPGMFDGQMQLPVVPENDLGINEQQPMLSKEGFEVAGPFGTAASKIGSGISRVFGETLSQARKKSESPEFQNREKRLFEQVDEVDEVAPAPPPEKADPETSGPILKELSDDIREAGEPPILPGIPEKFKTRDPYSDYIKVDRETADALLDPPPVGYKGLSDFNSKNIIDDGTIQARIEANSKQFEGKISAAKRERITNEATESLADLLGTSPKKLKKLTEAILERRTGQVISVDGKGLAETMLASRNLLVAEMRKLDGLAEIAKHGSDKQAMAFRYQLELVANLQKNIKGSQTEIARSLQAMRITATGVPSDPALAAEFAQRSQVDLTTMLGDYGGADQVRLMADLYSRSGAPHNKGAFIKGASKAKLVGNAIYEVWQHALLTNPVSQTKNILGNIVSLFLSNVETGVGAGIGTVRRAAGGEGGVTFQDLNAKIFGQTMSFITALKASGRSFATGTQATKVDPAQRQGQRHVPAFSGEAFGATGIRGTAIDVLGNAFTGGRVAFRALEFGDTFFKVLASQGKTWEQAMSAGRARGLKGEDLSDFIADFVNDPPQYALTRADAEAKYVSLQQEFDAAGKGFKAFQNIPGMRWIVPFLRTPYNSFKWSFIDRTPLGLFWGDTHRMLAAGGRERDEAIGRISVGSSIGMTSVMMVMGGMITGGGPPNMQERATDRRLGIQPYSLKIGDQYYSYMGLEPFASTLGIWADVGQIMSSGHLETEEDIAELFAAALAGTAYNMTNKSFMQGFATFLEAASDPNRYSKGIARNLFKSLIPRLASQMERVNDPIMRESRGYLDDIIAQIPGLSKSLLPRVDLWGRDAMFGIPTPGGGSNLAFGWDVASPIFVSRYKPNPVDLEIKRMKVRLSPPGDTILPEGMAEPMRLTDEQRYWYQQTAGKTAFKLIENYMKRPEYKQMKKLSEAGDKHITEILINKIRGIHGMAKREAETALISESVYSENLQYKIRAILELEANEKQQQMGNVQ